MIIALITTLSIVSLFFLNQTLTRLERNLVFDRLANSIELAKQQALTKNIFITICGSYDQRSCHHQSDWSRGFIIIENQEHSAREGRVIQVLPGIRHGKLYFDQFNTVLHITPDGTTSNLGTFTYCPNIQNKQVIGGLVINKFLRRYQLHNRDSQGTLLKNVGTSKETPVTCR
jgi:Tfp pilus assembly protein FimT